MEEHLAVYGVRINHTVAPIIRKILDQQINLEAERQGAGDTELMKLCCVQLFSLNRIDDIRLIWKAKTSSMDADCSIDVHLLCGPGLEKTIRYLDIQTDKQASDVLERIVLNKKLGIFEGFSVETVIRDYEEYYEL